MSGFAPDKAFNKNDEVFLKNIATFRGHLLKIIDDRKKGMSESYDGQSSDMLDILTKSEFFANKENKIIDEFIGMFMAGMKTTQATTTNLIQYLIKFPDLKKQLLDEINPKLDLIKDDFREKLSWDIIDEFHFNRNCFYESLRIAPPAPMSGTLCFLRDVQIKGINFPAGMAFWLNFTGMHHWPSEW